MGSGSSKGGAAPSKPNERPTAPANTGSGTNSRQPPAASSSGATGGSDATCNGWYWFEIYFSNQPQPPALEEEDDNDDDDDEAPSGNTDGNSNQPPVSGSSEDAPAASADTPADASTTAPEEAAEETPAENPAAPPEPTPASEVTPPQPAPSAPPRPTLPSLKVTGVDLNVLSNGFLHYTSEYEFDDNRNNELIVRRGQEFTIKVELNREYKPKRETLILQFALKMEVGRPMEWSGTLITIPVGKEAFGFDWSANLKSSDKNSVTLTVRSPPVAPVGRYSLSVLVESKKSGMRAKFPQECVLYMLFNPWCEQDAVYMGDKAEREEYVLSDMGRIWRGTYKSSFGMKWNFGQFDQDVRDAVFMVFESFVQPDFRFCPIKVSRLLSHAINERVLFGNWSGNYEDGVSPSHWNGSVKILEEFKRTNESVRYGQCWVFSGVFTTFLRCLGIPARSVTNFRSAHDTDGSMTIDAFVDEDGEKIAGADSVWNFHVWNEAWMTRDDLDPGFGGWQAVDATPQELSQGLYMCGPAPVLAIKRGLVNIPFDGKFIFAEVNSDRVTWKVKTDPVYPSDPTMASYKRISTIKNGVGANISTQRVGVDDDYDNEKNREVLTPAYKFAEGSDEERAVVKSALGKGSLRMLYNKDEEEPEEEVKITVTNLEDVFIGQDFKVKIDVHNTSSEGRTLFLKAKIESCSYTGRILNTVKTDKMDQVVPGNSHMEMVIDVTLDDYDEKIDDEGLLSVFVMAHIEETSRAVSHQDEIRLKIPDLDVKAEVEKSEVSLTIEFTNPLRRPLTRCEFEIEAPKLVKPFTVKHSDLQPGEKMKKTISFKAKKPGKKAILVEFDSKELRNVTGSVKVEVKED
ncbi:hemocyte protein-glutamine gamma-glutamyltransferase-like [Diadema setosum]|uniref:hemocyte protein-glutamine gamma-glutamyltransferase-like n=1 Tax=Diadema setosum TaxID=31175 RepID=UPI003B3A1A24